MKQKMVSSKSPVKTGKKPTMRKSEALRIARKIVSEQKANLSMQSDKATKLAKAINKLGKDYDDLVIKYSIVDIEQTVMAKCHCICFC